MTPMAYLQPQAHRFGSSWLDMSPDSNDPDSSSSTRPLSPPPYSEISSSSSSPDAVDSPQSSLLHHQSTANSARRPVPHTRHQSTSKHSTSGHSSGRMSRVLDGLEPFPIGLRPNLASDSKEPRAHSQTQPVPFTLSTPSSSVRPDLKGKSGTLNDVREAPTCGNSQRREPEADVVSSSIRPALHVLGNYPEPSGSGPPAHVTKHVFQLKDSRNNSGLTLVLESRARTPQDTPVFYSGDSITDSVYFTVGASNSSVRGVTLTLTGQLVASAYKRGTFTFLEHTTTIWSKASKSSVKGSAVKGSKVSGGYSWPICIPFPDDTTVPHPGGTDVPAHLAHAPPSFSKGSMGVTVQYGLTLRVCRRWFRSDSRLHTPLVYVPEITPSPPSPLIQLAYNQGSPLPSPRADREGWHTLSPVTLHGCVRNCRMAQIRYTLSLAQPLCYARGSVIPISLTVESQDSEALQMVSSSKVIDAVIKCRVRYYRDVSVYFNSLPRRADHQITEIEKVAKAVWWTPSQDGLQATTERRVEGEIHLEDALEPSSNFPLCLVEYFVVLYPPQCASFRHDMNQALATQAVRIGTSYPTECPHPISFGQPVLRGQSRKSAPDREPRARDLPHIQEEPY
ncbi:hypothetical protein AX16_007780 [Volvariella volvacea WC 439]|nr:hypothetical protein AX16_007780 [Volvariella volvacea WC 439]